MADALQSGYVVSDLHLFTKRTTAHEQIERLREAAASADFFVFNGDIIDFRWTVLPTVEDTADAALDWFRELAEAAPNCRFFYVLGNHDCIEFFTEHLVGFANEVPNFEWHPSYVRIGDALFLHGDLPMRRLRRCPITRPLPVMERKKGWLWNLGYHLFVQSHLHQFVPLLYNRRRVAKRILRSMRRDANGLLDGIRHIYFGHIHRHFSDFEYDGFMFHNTGAAIQGLHCNLLQVNVG